MTFSPQLAAQLVKEVLRREPDVAVLQEACQRLNDILERVQLLDPAAIWRLEPVGVFSPGHQAWSQPPEDGESWQILPTTSGGTGHSPGVRWEAGFTPADPPPRLQAPPPGGSAELFCMSATHLAQLVRNRQVSPVEVTQACLDRISALQPVLNSFITVAESHALDAAHSAEAALMRGDSVGPLHGVPVAVKDVFCTRGIPTTGGSKQLAGWLPNRDATTVARLRTAGAILMGKTHTNEWTFGGTGENVHYGPARNPWDPQRIPGGSSGGSAAAVAAGMARLALGGDAAGSVRIPGAACGVVGMMPTFGRVSRAGALLLSWSFDTVGVLADYVVDAALLLDILAGPDVADPTTAAVPPPGLVAALSGGVADLHGTRVGVDWAWLERVETDVRDAFIAAINDLQHLGARVCEIRLPAPEQMMLVHRLVMLPEASAYHSACLRDRAEDYGKEVRVRLELGQFLPAEFYLLGQRLRGELCRYLSSIMARVDVVVTPTLPMQPTQIGQQTWEAEAGTQIVAESLIRFTCPFNLTGTPAISVPCGYAGGLPIGLQIVARPFAEAVVLKVALAFESATNARRLRPPI